MNIAIFRSLMTRGVMNAAVVCATVGVVAFSGAVAADEKGRYYAHLHANKHHGHKQMGQYRGNRHGARFNHRHGKRGGKRHGGRHFDRRWDNRFGGFGHRFDNDRPWGHYGWGPRSSGVHIGIHSGRRYGARHGHRHGNRFGHGGRRNHRGNNAEYLIGGLIIGSAIANAIANRDSHAHSGEYETYDESSTYDSDYYMHKTLNGDCFEVRREDGGREIRTRVDPQRCDW